jgi:hypothetical protein
MDTLVGAKIAIKKTTKFITPTYNVGETLKKITGYQKRNIKKWKNVKKEYVLVVSRVQKKEAETVLL